MKKIILDIGNSVSKVAIYKDSLLTELFKFETLSGTDIQKILYIHPDISHSILSSVKEFPVEIENILRSKTNYYKPATTDFFPLKIIYDTPETLGFDRVAAAIGGFSIFPDENILVITVGTCVIYDFVDKAGNYLGGAISPGIDLRLKALHTFTGKLPLVEKQQIFPALGTNTRDSILCGVINGLKLEMEGFINQINEQFPGLKVILSGGDAFYFDKNLNYSIFAVPNIVTAGLNAILDFHAKNELF
jgi:type III pantothenate kinase